jgi:TonB family protein
VANILVIEYEPRYIERVRKALGERGHRVEVAGDIDQAILACAGFNPQLVILTSILPRIKIEEAIAQLRVSASLRGVPFVIMMSGYRGSDSRADATRYGAQDIIERPFSGDALVNKVNQLLLDEESPAATQAIPQDMLETLRRTAGLSKPETPSADDLVSGILAETGAPTSTPKAAAAPAADEGTEKTEGPKTTVQMAKPSDEIDQVLQDVLQESKAAEPVKRKPTSSETDVDLILSKTLAGLDIQPLAGKAPAKKKPPTEAIEAPKVKEEPALPPAQALPKIPEKEAPPDEPTPVPPEPEPEPFAVESAASKPDLPEPEPLSKEELAAADAPTPPSGIEQPAPASRPPEPLPDEEPAPAADTAAAEPKTPVEPGTVFGQYTLEEHIATGGMAEVYKARMVGMEGFRKTVAIKRILPHLTDNEEFVNMFIDEAKLAAQLNHNNIIHIYELGKVDRSHYIAMEYIEGRDLRSILQECRERQVMMPVPLTLYIGTLLASALDYAHRKQDFDDRDLGLVHRDVSPQNVLISDEGVIKLCDFGIAKAASKASHTRAGALKGKLQYMSPEQAWGKDIDHRSDIFSLGLVLFEMLTGEKLFAGDSEMSILEQVRNPKVEGPSRYNPDVTSEIEKIVLKALESDCENRYQFAQELQRDMEKSLRRKGWSPSSSDVARFMRELSSGRKISPIIAGDTSTDAQPAPTPAELMAPEQPLTPELLVKPPVVEPVPPEDSAEPPDSPPPEQKEPTAVPPPAKKSGLRLGLLSGVAVLVVVVAGLLYIFKGTGQTPPTAVDEPVGVVTSLPSPTATPSEAELAAIRAAAQARVDQEAERIRERLEEEFPTPTPRPPTATPEPTEVPTELPSPTPTRRPPTPTRVPTATPIPPTPTPSVREGDIVPDGPGVSRPVVISQTSPQYPRAAERMRLDGEVQLQALVGISGQVEQVRILKVSHKNMGFETESEKAVRQWRYKPATKKGVKVRMWVTIRIPFRQR